MFNLSRNATILWLGVVASGLAILAHALAGAPTESRYVVAAVLFIASGAIAETFGVRMPSLGSGQGIQLAVSAAVLLAGVLVFPLEWAIVVNAAAIGIAQTIRRKAWFKVAFNVGQYALTAGAAAFVWELAGPQRSLTNPSYAPWLLAVLLTYFFVNSVLVTTLVSLAQGLPVHVMWWRAYRNILPAYLGMLVVGVLIAVLWSTSPWMIALAFVPLTALYYAVRNTVNLETQTIEALFQLADILDARDPYTHGHSQRVGEYAQQLALAMGVSGDDAYLVYLAGRLHDVGKCAVRNEVLLKPGPLDPEEREHMCQHPSVGGAMLGHFALFRECARFVRGHHERWDGAGYPDGLRAEGIPLGARIIAVADAYDAMTTTRPYRTALPEAEAVRRLREGLGTQWDPRATLTFIEKLDRRRAPSPTRAPVPIAAAGATS